MVKLTSDPSRQALLDSLGFALGLVPVRIEKVTDADIERFAREFDIQQHFLVEYLYSNYDPFEISRSFETVNPYVSRSADNKKR